MKKILFIYPVIILVLCSCINGKGDCGGPGVNVYKFREDYTQLAFIRKVDGKYSNPLTARSFIEINGNDTIILDKSTKLVDGYRTGTYSSATVFLSITWKELWLMEVKRGSMLSDKELQKYIFEENPFLEFYNETNCPRLFSWEDTVKLNNVIRNGELPKYFKRLK